MGRNGEVIIIRLSITPSANRNTYSVATLIIHIPRVEALRTSTLGYEIATPTELPRVRTIHNGPLISLSSPCSINEWRTTTTALPPTAPLHLIIYIGRTFLPTLGYEKTPDRVELGLLMKYERLNSTV